MCTFIFYFYIWECDLSSFPEEYCLDKFLVNISFMVIYYLILKAIAFQILSYFVYATDTAVLCYFIFRLIFMDIAGNNISVSNFLSFFFLFWDFELWEFLFWKFVNFWSHHVHWFIYILLSRLMNVETFAFGSVFPYFYTLIVLKGSGWRDHWLEIRVKPTYIWFDS